MTFLANVLTKDDLNNSSSGSLTSYIGTSTDTTGYNSLIITITNNIYSGIVKILFSSDGTTFNTFYTDTIFSGSAFIKTYPILKKYYKIDYSCSVANTNLSILSRLSTQSYQSNIQNSINTFENDQQNMMDAFGKLRVTTPYTILDLKIPGQDATGLGTTGSTGYISNDIQICYKGTTAEVGATGYKVSSNSKCVITTSGKAKFINQSRKYCVYQPGKSLLYMASAIIGYTGPANPSGGSYTTGPTGFYSRIGYFDDHNGLYYQCGSTGEISLNIRSSNITTSIKQDTWNIDTMKGNGPSGLTLNWYDSQIFVIDMEWLGVGRVRFGFYAYGRIQYCHQEVNVNYLLQPYTNNINLPSRFELDGLTGGTGSASITQICSTVISEGGYNPAGRPFSIASSNSSFSSDTILLMFRGGNTNGNYYHQNILPTDLSLMTAGTSDIFSYKLTLYFAGATTSSTNWQDVNSLSVCEYSTTGSITTGSMGSIIVEQGFVQGRTTTTFTNLGNIFTNLLQINSDVDNVSDILVLSATKISTGGSILYYSIHWQEIY